jgi:peptide/nickel transport system substrate-binding protein
MKLSFYRCALIALPLLGWVTVGCRQLVSDTDPIESETGTPIISLPTLQTPNPSQEAAIPPSIAAETTAQPDFTPLSFSAPDCSYGGKFLKIESVDALTVRFELCSPEVAFLTKMAFPPFSIYPTGWLEESGVGKGSQLWSLPVGSGPYQLEKWTSGEEIRLTAFKEYWDFSESAVPELVLKWNLDASQRLLDLQTGTAQGIDSPKPEDFLSLEDDDSIKWIQRAPLSVAFLGMNNTYPPFDNQLVRQAISLALDRQAIVEKYFAPGSETADFFTPCIIPNGCVGEPWFETDPEQARQLFAQAGFPDGFHTQLSYRNVVRGYMDNPEQIAREIQTQLKEILNIDVELIPIDTDQFVQASKDGLLPGLFLLGWGADYPDVSNFLDNHFGDLAGKLLGNPFNDILEPLRLGISTPDFQIRLPYYVQANNSIRNHVPLIPIAHSGWVNSRALAVAFSHLVVGAYADPMGFERFSEMDAPGLDELVWMQVYEPLSLYCADETDSDTLRACSQISETLYRYKPGSLQTEPGLAENCEPNPEMTVWTCRLRKDVAFHDGSLLDANDVVLSIAVQWDAAHPLHKGRLGDFSYFESFWGEFLNAPAP